jgi:hypothetical protein
MIAHPYLMKVLSLSRHLLFQTADDGLDLTHIANIPDLEHAF